MTDVERDEPQIVFAGGGTGGHLYPALAVAAQLHERHPRASIWFIGARRGLESRLVPQAGYRVRLLGLSGIKGGSAAGKAVAALAAAWGVCRCVLWFVAERPDLVVGVGGYASGPAVLAARVLRVRTMVMEQNHFPGATNRWLAPRVDAVCVPSEAARQRLGGVGEITGTPVREEFTRIGEPPAGDALSLLAFGGSHGARSINRAMTAALDELARLDPPPRICHQTGAEDLAAVEQAATRYPAGRYEVAAFLDDMPQRLAAADLAVCRAGASTLAELAAAGRPALLVPYPYAADDHQRHNAETLQSAGAAVVIGDAELDGPRLAGCVRELTRDAARLRRMGAAARALGRPDAARRIADVVDHLLGVGTRQRGDHVP